MQGGVGLRLRVFDRILCFVNCHFAAHLEAVNRRNADFDHIYRTMTFCKSSNFFNNAAGMLRHLLYLSSALLFPIFIFRLLYSFGLPWILCFAAGVSSANQMLRANVCLSYNSEKIVVLVLDIPISIRVLFHELKRVL